MSKRVTDSRAFRNWGLHRYLADQDRFLTADRNPQLRLGVIGCGMMGQEHIRNAALVGRAQIAGLYDPAAKSIEHAQQQSAIRALTQAPRVYDSIAAACADPNTDILLIASPNHTHLEVMREVHGCGKAIFLEKPIATNITDALEVCRLAATHNNLVRVGLQYRYKAIYAEALAEVLQRKSVGQVHSVSLLEHRFPFLDKVGQWNKFNANTGGTLVEKCCHYFDLLNQFSQSLPEQVFALGNQAVNFKEFSYEQRQADGIDQAQVTINYSNGVIGAFSLCMFVAGAKEELVICGDAGRLQAHEQAQLGEKPRNQLELWAGENGASRTSVPAYPSYIANAGHHGASFFEHMAFMDDIESGTATGPTLADAFWSIVIGSAAQKSIEQRSAIDIKDLLPTNFDPEVLS